MLLVLFWALSNFVTFVSFFSYFHDRESRTHHLHMLKLPHRKDSNFIPSTHSYPLLCSIFRKVSPKILSNKGMSHVLRKKRGHMKAHEKKYGHMKVHAKKNSRAKNIRRERQNHGTPYPFSFHSIHHIPTHMHSSIMVVTCLQFWVQSLTLQNIWCKYAFSIKELVFLFTNHKNSGCKV